MKKRKTNSRRRQTTSLSRNVWFFILLAGAIAVGYLGGARSEYLKKFAKATRPSGRVQIKPTARKATQPEIRGKIYYLSVTNGKQRLVAVSRDLPGDAPARAALEGLLQLPPAGLESPLPPGVTLRKVTVTEGVARADFSRTLVTNFAGGSDNEGAAVYAIVDTLTSLPGVKQAQILVEGQPIDSLGGHLDISAPLSFDGELVSP